MLLASQYMQGGTFMRTYYSSISWLATLAASMLLASILLWVTGCGQKGDVPTASIASSAGTTSQTGSSAHPKHEDPVTLVATNGEFKSPAQSDEELHPEVLIKTNLGAIRVRLNWEKAPRTVANFLYNYVEKGFYDQTVFHFVEDGYMIAGGGYSAALQEKQTQPPIPCEANNGLSNKRGTIAMARHPGFAASATSQFFINLVDNTGLDYKPADDMNGYCVFGEVVEGMDVVDKIAQVSVHDQGDLVKTPVQRVVIESVTRVK